MPQHPLVFNANVSQCKSQKHLGIILNSKLKFENHYKTVLSKENKTIGPLRKLKNFLLREAFLTIYKTLVRPYLNFAHVLFDQASSSNEKLESIQYNACLAVTRTIRGTSKSKLYQELGLESLMFRCWYRQRLFYTVFNDKSSVYLFNLIPPRYTRYSLRSLDNMPCFNKKNSFFSKIKPFHELESS